MEKVYILLEQIKKNEKYKKMVFSAIAVLIVVALIGTTIVCRQQKKNNYRKIENSDITVEGNLGTAVFITNSGVKEKTKEYQNVKEKLEKNNLIDFNITDITIYNKKNNKVQPNGDVKITMKIPQNVRCDDEDYVYKVFRTEKNQTLTELECKVDKKNHNITFKTEHFSIYTIAKYNKRKGLESLKTKDIDSCVIEMDKTMYALVDVNVMSGPNSTFDVIGNFVKDQEVKVVGEYQENGYYKVKLTEDTFGYVSNDSLTEEKPTNPIVSSGSSGTINGNSETGNEGNNDGVDKNNGRQITTNPRPELGKGKPQPTPQPGKAKPQPTPQPGKAKPQPTPQPEPAKPQPTPQPEPAKPQPIPQPEPAKNNCPYPLLTWTTYQGHEGFFASTAQRSSGGKAADMETDLYLKNGSVQTIQVGYFDDVGVVAFYY